MLLVKCPNPTLRPRLLFRRPSTVARPQLHARCCQAADQGAQGSGQPAASRRAMLPSLAAAAALLAAGPSLAEPSREGEVRLLQRAGGQWACSNVCGSPAQAGACPPHSCAHHRPANPSAGASHRGRVAQAADARAVCRAAPGGHRAAVRQPPGPGVLRVSRISAAATRRFVIAHYPQCRRAQPEA